MAEFKKSWAKTSHNEGGYANDSRDAGKETFKGIARHFWPQWEGWPIVDAAVEKLGLTGKTLDAGEHVWKLIDAELASNQELDAAVQAFYKKNFFDPLNLDNEPEQLIADVAFDTAVNKGKEREKNWLNRAREEANEIV